MTPSEPASKGASPTEQAKALGLKVAGYRLDHIDHVGYLHLGELRRDYPDDVTAKKSIQPMADYWKHHGHKVIISRVYETGLCITI